MSGNEGGSPTRENMAVASGPSLRRTTLLVEVTRGHQAASALTVSASAPNVNRKTRSVAGIGPTQSGDVVTVKLELTPEVEAGLVAQAQARGLTLEAYLQQVLRERSAAIRVAPGGPKEKAQAFEAWARAHRPVGTLSDEALRRENLVRDAR